MVWVWKPGPLRLLLLYLLHFIQLFSDSEEAFTLQHVSHIIESCSSAPIISLHLIVLKAFFIPVFLEYNPSGEMVVILCSLDCLLSTFYELLPSWSLWLETILQLTKMCSSNHCLWSCSDDLLELCPAYKVVNMMMGVQNTPKCHTRSSATTLASGRRLLSVLNENPIRARVFSSSSIWTVSSSSSIVKMGRPWCSQNQ